MPALNTTAVRHMVERLGSSPMSAKHERTIMSKRLVDDFVRQALSPEEHKEYEHLRARVLENRLAIPAQVVGPATPEAMIDAMAEALRSRLERAMSDAQKDRREKNAVEMPWVHRATAQRMLEDIGRLEWLNSRIQQHARERFAETTIMADTLHQQKAIARDVLRDKQTEAGKVLTGFVLKLKHAGLKTESVKDLSKSALAALADALNGAHTIDLWRALGVSDGTRVSDEEAEADLETILAAAAEMKASLLAEDHRAPAPPAAIKPEVPTNLTERWNYDDGPLPPEFWSTVQELPAPYSWRYRVATPEEEKTVLGMQLPEAHDWAALRSWNRHFRGMAMEAIRTRKAGRRTVSEFIGNEWGVPPDDVPENVIRIWLYLLAGRLMTLEECNAMFEQEYFAGAVMPCPATGGGVVRELVCEPTDRDGAPIDD